jgi:hypothetical protein
MEQQPWPCRDSFSVPSRSSCCVLWLCQEQGGACPSQGSGAEPRALYASPGSWRIWAKRVSSTHTEGSSLFAGSPHPGLSMSDGLAGRGAPSEPIASEGRRPGSGELAGRGRLCSRGFLFPAAGSGRLNQTAMGLSLLPLVPLQTKY